MTDRQAVMLQGIPALALTLGAIWLSTRLDLPEAWNADRLHLAAACVIAVSAWLVFAVLLVSTHRLFSSADAPGPALSEPSPALRLKLAFLQNTLEQVVLAAIAYASFAVLARMEELALLPLFAALFWLGRICFLFGHGRGMRGRAFGFALTFLPTLSLFVMLAKTLIAS